MSTVSFAPPPSHPSPAYSRIPNDDERRIILRQPPTQPDSSFSKQSKSGSLTLTIYGQQPGLSLPVFGRGHDIHARVQLSKCDSVASVDLKLDGFLRLREVGGAGASSDHILAQQLNLWSKIDSATCPSALDFDVQLETTYKKVNEAYPLPPTYDVHLSGLPGFRADVQYSITIVVTKSKGSLFGNHTIVSTPFIYHPRTRPGYPLPVSSHATSGPEWEVVESTMGTRFPHTQPILTKLYIPIGRSFSKKSPIPFRLQIESSAISLAAFLPCSPTAQNKAQNKAQDEKRGVTRVYVIRQISVDVRNVQSAGTKTDIFKVIAVGEGGFRLFGDGADWAAWDGEINLDESLINVSSFKAGGLWVKDFIILSIVPPGSHSSPFLELRTLVPIRLVTDPQNSDTEFVAPEWMDRDEKGGL